MDRKRGPYKSKKRKFHGNRFTKKDKSEEISDGKAITDHLPQLCSGAGTSSTTSTLHIASNATTVATTVVSASKRKFGYDYESQESETPPKKRKGENYEEQCPPGNLIVDMELLSQVVSEVCHCLCGEKLTLEISKRSGLATTLNFVCKGLKCGKVTPWHTSKKIGKNSFTTNRQFVYALSCIGKGRTAGEQFCGLMNMNPPSTQKSWDKHFTAVLNASEVVSKESMEAAAKELQADGKVTDVAVTCDGTWQKRGHSSLHGVVTVLSSKSGKVLDYEALSRYCHSCRTKKSVVLTEEEKKSPQGSLLCKL